MWDQNLLNLLLDNKIFDTGFDFEPSETKSNGAVFVIPGAHCSGDEKLFEATFNAYDWVLAIKTSDEEDLFDWKSIKHPNIKWWIQTPRTDRDYGNARLFGVGYPEHFNNMQEVPVIKTIVELFLSAQDTHERRHQAFSALESMSDKQVFLNKTEGFTQGISKEAYAAYMLRANIAPAPSGVISPDSFRLYEALESHTVPVADDISPNYNSEGYWRKVYPDAPFPILKNWEDLPGYTKDIENGGLELSNRITAWWINKKREMATWLTEDVKELSGLRPLFKSDTTVLIPVSPIKSHPSTAILEETIKSVRHNLPDSEIILMFDGVRPEQEGRRADYELFIRNMLWKANHEYKNILPVIFNVHQHQTGMTRAVLDMIRTPLLLFVEQDTPLVIDEPIEWNVCTQNILVPGNADVIRFHHEGVIPKDHEHMIHGYLPQSTMFLRTSQWSQRPHLSTVAFYRRILDTCFTPESKSFIEDKMHGVCDEAYRRDGLLGWQNYRVVIYAPQDFTNIKRSYHTDGRAGEAKYDDTQVF